MKKSRGVWCNVGSSLLLAVSILSVSQVIPAHAADKDKAAKQQEKRMRQMVQQAQAEKQELQAKFDQESAKLKQEAEAEQAKASALQGSISSANRKNAALNADLEKLQQEKAKLAEEKQAVQDKLASAEQQLAEARDVIRKGEAERTAMQATIVKKQQQVNASQEKNDRLHDFGLQLVKIYDKPSTYEQVMRDEKFTQLKRVELENILQDYRDKLDEAKAVPGEIKQ